jgi:hypothetical protein
VDSSEDRHALQEFDPRFLHGDALQSFRDRGYQGHTMQSPLQAAQGIMRSGETTARSGSWPRRQLRVNIGQNF